VRAVIAAVTDAGNSRDTSPAGAFSVSRPFSVVADTSTSGARTDRRICMRATKPVRLTGSPSASHRNVRR
jgi:hypothetical protein